MAYGKHFRVAVLAEIQYNLFVVDTKNYVNVYEVFNDYKHICSFKIQYNLLVPIKPNFFMTTGLMSDSIDIYDSNSIKIVKKIPKK